MFRMLGKSSRSDTCSEFTLCPHSGHPALDQTKQRDPWGGTGADRAEHGLKFKRRAESRPMFVADV